MAIHQLDLQAQPAVRAAFGSQRLLEPFSREEVELFAGVVAQAAVRPCIQRLHLKSEARAADARDTAKWWDGRPFDAILLDAPCSASGIVRRHPDIRWLRRADDLSALTRIQSELLQALWPLLKPGGRLVYATCSIFRCEGQQRIDAFLQRLPDGGAQLDGASPGHLLPLPDNPPWAAVRAPCVGADHR